MTITRSLSVSLAGWTTVVLSCAIAPAFAADDIVFLAGGRSHGPGEHEFNAGCQFPLIGIFTDRHFDESFTPRLSLSLFHKPSDAPVPLFELK